MSDNLINEKEDDPLAFADLKKMVGADAQVTNFFMYSQLAQMTPAQLFSKPACIILMQNKKSKSNVGHFMCILEHKSNIEHFDSYGYTIDEELNITGEPDTIVQLLNERGKKLLESKFAFQSTRNDSETCGRWVVSRIKMRDMSIQEFKEFFDRAIVTKDQKVVLLTYFLG